MVFFRFRDSFWSCFPEEEGPLNGSCEICWWSEHPHHQLPMTIATDWPLAGCLCSSPGMDESWKLNSPSPWLPRQALRRSCIKNRGGKSVLLFFMLWSIDQTKLFCFHWCQGSVFHECYLNNVVLREQSQVALGTLFCVDNWFCATSGQQKCIVFANSFSRKCSKPLPCLDAAVSKC